MKKYRLTLNSLSNVLNYLDIQGCDVCPISGKAVEGQSCYEYCQSHLEEAAALIGFEIVDEESKFAKDVNTHCKADKPRLAKILGVEVGEKFKIPINGGIATFEITENGKFKTDPPNMVGSTYMLLEAIERPEIIIHQTRLTPDELTICKALGAKWVSRDDEEPSFSFMDVRFWKSMPSKGSRSYYTTESDSDTIALCDAYLFPSLKPGDLVNVEDLINKV